MGGRGKTQPTSQRDTLHADCLEPTLPTIKNLVQKVNQSQAIHTLHALTLEDTTQHNLLSRELRVDNVRHLLDCRINLLLGENELVLSKVR